MRKIFFIILTILLGLSATGSALAQNNPDYQITDFDSSITINQDTTITVEETITVNFTTDKHGIFRNIPVNYTGNNRVIRARLTVNEVLLNDQPVNYSTSRVNQSIQIKIGDPTKTITGIQTYRLTYTVSDIIQRYPDYDELYWNVTGHEWDTAIATASVSINSPFASPAKITCFAGRAGTKASDCAASVIVDDNNQPVDQAAARTTQTVLPGNDFTVVVALTKDNRLNFPPPSHYLFQQMWFWLGILILFLPGIALIYFWYKKGRDFRYLTDNFYLKPENQPIRSVGPLERKHLPLQYQPIKGLTPAQVGTIIDQKVDIADVVAEIVELARLRLIKIDRISQKAFLGKKTDYQFTRLDKSSENIKEYQKYLLEKLFEESTDGITVKLSDLKEKFYAHLATFKNKLYQNMKEEGYFDGNPARVKQKWIGNLVLWLFLSFLLTFIYTGFTKNSLPFVFLPVAIPVNLIVGFLVIRAMPRRTAWGYSLYRQIEGLRYFINVGKWREEIAEKNLFLEEILPLAVALGVVTKLASDMKDLAPQPPDYLTGFTVTAFARDFTNFNTLAATNMTSSPGGKWSGSSSWSGGSGFGGGGSSGGGFGGGGGGSW